MPGPVFPLSGLSDVIIHYSSCVICAHVDSNSRLTLYFYCTGLPSVVWHFLSGQTGIQMIARTAFMWRFTGRHVHVHLWECDVLSMVPFRRATSTRPQGLPETFPVCGVNRTVSARLGPGVHTRSCHFYPSQSGGRGYDIPRPGWGDVLPSHRGRCLYYKRIIQNIIQFKIGPIAPMAPMALSWLAGTRISASLELMPVPVRFGCDKEVPVFSGRCCNSAFVFVSKAVNKFNNRSRPYRYDYLDLHSCHMSHTTFYLYDVKYCNIFIYKIRNVRTMNTVQYSIFSTLIYPVHVSNITVMNLERNEKNRYNKIIWCSDTVMILYRYSLFIL